MKYIPGFEFIVKAPKTTGSMLQQQTMSNLRSPRGNFNPQQLYVIRSITPRDGQFHYQFVNRSLNQFHNEVFDSPQAADNAIDRLLGA